MKLYGSVEKNRHMDLEVLFCDNHMLVVNKPAGIPTQPDGNCVISLEEICKEWVRTKFQKPGNVFLHALHRIDKPVCGIVVFARTSKALSRLNEAMRCKTTKKIYFAYIDTVLEKKEAILEHYLIHGDFKALVSSKDNPNAKFSRLSYQTIQQYKNGSLLKVELDTGRYHQIRIQLASIGAPIAGDKKYGSCSKRLFGAIALQHCCFEIPHPISKETMIFTLDLDPALLPC